MRGLLPTAFLLANRVAFTVAFAPPARTFVSYGSIVETTRQPTAALQFSPNEVMDTASSLMTSWNAGGGNHFLETLSSSDLLLSFSDQGKNLAGTLFQASLLPYLLFLYFLSFRANRLGKLANFGFQFVLPFVLSTIPSGIVSRSLYGCSLADTDWMHGGAEALLTVANVLIVLGMKDCMTQEKQSDELFTKGRNVAWALAGAYAVALALGPGLLGFQAHSEYLFGLGNLPETITQQLPWVIHSEPVNALSIPTWAIHFSSVFEYLFAMNLVWNYSKTTGNESWKGLTWAMLPLHASGVCACTYHFFYNPSSLQFLVSMQAGLTFLGNVGCALAAFRIAKSNGWTLDEVNPFPRSSTDPRGLVADGIAALPLAVDEKAVDSNQVLAAKLIGLTVVSSYLMKYGELGLDLPFEPNAAVALAVVLGIPTLTGSFYFREADGALKLPFLSGGDDSNKPSLSMADVKKYGVAGTVAYILTELAFWVVAFPVAGFALYQSAGHWPDVINDNTDRAAVLAFIFAGSNIARLLVPLRFGAALALAPWVDENIINRGGSSNTEKAIDVEKVEA